MRSVLLLTALALAAPSAPEKAPAIDKIDRTRAVGAPVLDDDARPGLYVWVEDGAFQLAAVPPRDGKSKRRRSASFAAHFVSTERVTTKRADDFVVRGGGKSVQLSTRSSQITRGAFVTDGDVTITASKGVPLFVGPLAKRAARTLRIGRF